MRGPVLGCVAAALLVAGCGPSGEARTGPPSGTAFDYQLGGGYPPAGDVGIVVRDRTDAPDPARYSVCYVNAFQTQPGADDVPEELLLHDATGARVADPDWPGEYLLDVSSARRDAVVALVRSWFAGCAEDGFDAVEADNLDSWTRSRGLLDAGDAAATAELLVAAAHEHGLAIAQKNAAELLGADLGFDFAVVEDCAQFGECDDVAAAYDVVLDVEYEKEAFLAACADPVDGVAVQLRDRAVSPAGSAGYLARDCADR